MSNVKTHKNHNLKWSTEARPPFPTSLHHGGRVSPCMALKKEDNTTFLWTAPPPSNRESPIHQPTSWVVFPQHIRSTLTGSSSRWSTNRDPPPHHHPHPLLLKSSHVPANMHSYCRVFPGSRDLPCFVISHFPVTCAPPHPSPPFWRPQRMFTYNMCVHDMS